MGGWTVVPPYLGPAFNAEMRVEIADHVVPGLALLAVSAAALAGRRRWPALTLAIGLVAGLAGMWGIATHIPLLAQANRGEVSWSLALYHLAPGLADLALGLVTTWLATATDGALPSRAPAGARGDGQAAGDRGPSRGAGDP